MDHGSRCAANIYKTWRVYGHQPYTAHHPHQLSEPTTDGITRVVASWTPAHGLSITNHDRGIFMEKFDDFEDCVINVTALPFPPYWNTDTSDATGPPHFSGTDYKLLQTLGQALNFRPRVMDAKNWSQVTELVEARVSLAATVIYAVLPQRLDSYDFTFIFEHAYLSFSMAKPGLRPYWQSLYYPLSHMVWLGILGTLMVTPIIFLLIARSPLAIPEAASHAKRGSGQTHSKSKLFYRTASRSRNATASRSKAISNVTASRSKSISKINLTSRPGKTINTTSKSSNVLTSTAYLVVKSRRSTISTTSMAIRGLQENLAILLGQSMTVAFYKSSSSKVLFCSWSIFALLVTTAYRSNLTAYLTYPVYPPRPETLAQLVQSGAGVTMPPYSATFKEFFLSSSSPQFRSLGERFTFVKSITEGLQKELTHKSAHMDPKRYQDLVIAEQFTEADGGSRIYIARDSITPGLSAWPLPHDAPYKRNFDKRLQTVVEAGLYEKWSKDIVREASSLSKERARLASVPGNNRTESDQLDEATTIPSPGVKPLSVDHLQGPLMILGFGCLAALILFIGEILLYY